MEAFSTEEQNNINQLINQPQPRFIPYVAFMFLKNKDDVVNQENIVSVYENAKPVEKCVKNPFQGSMI